MQHQRRLEDACLMLGIRTHCSQREIFMLTLRRFIRQIQTLTKAKP